VLAQSTNEEAGASVLSDEEWCSVPEAAKRVNMPSRTLYNRIRAGSWPVRVIRLGGQYRVNVASLDAWLSEQWISVPEAARRVNVPARTLYNWIKAGSWPVRVTQSDGQYRVNVAALNAWLNSLRAS
jgi:excisionase family DNA binding protein